jgi:hypothetical protein
MLHILIIRCGVTDIAKKLSDCPDADNAQDKRAGSRRDRANAKPPGKPGSGSSVCHVSIIGGLFDVIVVSIDPSHDHRCFALDDHDLVNISQTAVGSSIQTTVENPMCLALTSMATTNLECKIPREVKRIASSGVLEDNSDETEP